MGEAASFGAAQETMGLTNRGRAGTPVRRSLVARAKLVSSGARGGRAKRLERGRGHPGDRGSRELGREEAGALRGDGGRETTGRDDERPRQDFGSNEGANAPPRGGPAASTFGSAREQTRRKAPWFGPASFPTRGMAAPNLAVRASRTGPFGERSGEKSEHRGRETGARTLER